VEYVEQRDGGYYVAGVRVTLDSVVYAHLRGQSPEQIVQSFPLLNVEQVKGAIDYYLAHRAEIDAYLELERIEFERLRQEAREKDPAFYAKMDNARRELLGRRR
jgi:uncharacterized protein (DUF433 family)